MFKWHCNKKVYCFVSAYKATWAEHNEKCWQGNFKVGQLISMTNKSSKIILHACSLPRSIYLLALSVKPIKTLMLCSIWKFDLIVKLFVRNHDNYVFYHKVVTVTIYLGKCVNGSCWTTNPGKYYPILIYGYIFSSKIKKKGPNAKIDT